MAYVIPRNACYVVPVAKLRASTFHVYPTDATARLYEPYREAWHSLGAIKSNLTPFDSITCGAGAPARCL